MRPYIACAALAVLVAVLSAASAAGVAQGLFGRLPDARKADAVTPSNRHGMRAFMVRHGAILQAWRHPATPAMSPTRRSAIQA